MSKPDASRTTTTHARLRDLFEACADLAPEARKAFLREQGITDDVERLLEAMLSADARARDVFDTPASTWAEQLQPTTSEVDALVGTSVGGFRIVAVLGQGGSAVVFRAERELAGASQSVALKLLRTGLFSAEAQRRFRQEQSILTQLSHPNIAHLIDAGISAAGIPYIAMELVDGVPLTEYAERHALDESARLRLLAELGRAIDTAHRTLVVHRDLKPSNVLVNGNGEIKVLDFGIAKLLGDEGETSTQHIALTPGYAAPEQYRSGPVTTAVDVYALGVVASELLLGVRLGADAAMPRDRDDADVARTRWRTLDPDLATFLRTALAADPARRYASAHHYADDIERFLRDEPIAARAPSRGYRARKFIARHRAGVVAGSLFVLALIAALGIALWQAQVARQEARRANSISTFVEGLFAPLRDGIAEGKQPSLVELVGKGVARIDETPSLGAAERVHLLLLFARVNDYLNERDQLQQLTQRASALADAELGREHPLAVESAVSYALATLRRSEYTQVRPLFDDAEQRLRATGIRGDSWIRLNDGLALLTNDNGDPVRALGHARTALAERIAVYGDGSDEAIGGYANLGFALEGVGRFGDAADAYRLVYASRVKRTGAESSRSASALAGLGSTELMAGELQQAHEHLRGSQAVFDALGGAKPRSAHVASSQQTCAVEIVLASPSAATTCAHTVAIARAAESPPGNNVARALRLQGMLLMQDGDLVAARRALEESAATYKTDAPANWKGRTDIALGELALVEGDVRTAAAVLAHGVERLGNGYPPYLRRYGLALLALSCDLGAGAAAPCATDTRTIAATALKDDAYSRNPLLLAAHSAMARIALRRGDVRDAAAQLRPAIDEAIARGLPATHPYLLEAQLWLAAAEAAVGRCDVSAALVRGATATIERAALTKHPILVPALAAVRESSCRVDTA